jgi:hypothetical protein
VSSLPDAAADVYAPGWDVSQHQRDGRNMMVSYGLGSPFPEDAKLCAALNSFWPAVAPDASRTYGFRPPQPDRPRRQLFTSLPLTDRELGYHPKHPRVLAGEVTSDAGWDGDYGPYLSSEPGAQFVYASNPLRADLTKSALDGKVHLAGLDNITPEEFVSRVHALNWSREKLDEWCRKAFGKVFNHRESGWWLVAGGWWLVAGGWYLSKPCRNGNPGPALFIPGSMRPLPGRATSSYSARSANPKNSKARPCGFAIHW